MFREDFLTGCNQLRDWDKGTAPDEGGELESEQATDQAQRMDDGSGDDSDF